MSMRVSAATSDGRSVGPPQARPAPSGDSEVREATSAGALSLYICRACGLIYDEAKGDEDSGLAAGTRFADIPDDWACPLCGVTKNDFEPYVPIAIEKRARSSATSESQRTTARHNAGTVIVGAGRAGWQMAEALRARDDDMPITLVTACNGDVYDKPLLSVAMARGLAPGKLPKETGRQAAERLGVKLMPQTQAVHVLVASRQLRTTRGTLRYQHLVLAHGAEARALPQFPPALCWRINHLQTYARFRAALGDSPQRIAVVGAGLIGSELANDLALAGHRITLLDVAARPLAACASASQSNELLGAWRQLALDFVGSVQVSRVEEIKQDDGKSCKQIFTTCGGIFQVDHIVLAAGLQTPSRLANSAGLRWNNGIDVQADTLATSVSGIHALGDCIAINGQVSRYIEPIGRQAQTLSAAILGAAVIPFQQMAVPVRVKTGSLPFTL